MAVQDLSIIYGSSGFGKISKEVESLTASATKSSSAFASLGSSIVSIGATAGAGFALSALTSEMFRVEDATASLQAITGATGQTLAFLGEQASKSGRDVQGGATAMLAGFEAIGSARPELLKNSEALAAVATDAKVLAQAAGGELADNAKAVTTAMAQFNLQAGASSRIINVLAAGSLEGAAGIAELNDGLQVSGGVLNKMGTSLEDSVALLELLADNGLKGAEAGTQLRNIFATFASGELLPKESVDLMQELGVNIELLSSASTPTIDKLKELSKITADTAATTKIFGKESFTAATYLGDGVARFGQLSKAVTGTNVAFQQAAIRTSTTSFQLLRLKNAGIELGVKLLSAFKPLIQGAAALAEGLIGVASAISDNKAIALIAVGVIAAYNGALIASTAATIANGIATKATAAFTALQSSYIAAATVAQAAYITVTNALTGSITIATAAQTLLNIALTANPVGLVIAGVTALGAALYFLTDRTQKLTEVEQAAADASAKVAEQFGKESANSEILFRKLKNLNPASAEAKKIRDEINTTYATYLPNQLTEASNLNDIAAAQNAVTAALLKKIQSQVTEAKITEIVAKKTENLLTTTDEIGKATGLTASRITSAVSEFAKLIGGRPIEEAGAIFEKFGYNASALSGAMVRLGGVSSGTAKAIEEINRAGLGVTFLDMALSAAQAETKIKALTDLFATPATDITPKVNGTETAASLGLLEGLRRKLEELQEAREKAKTAGEVFGFTKQIERTQAEIDRLTGSLEKAAAAGSINALNAQLQRLQDQFDATGNAATRANLGRQIEELGFQIERLQGAGSGVNPLAPMVAGLGSLPDVMQNSARASDFFAEQMAANMATAETAALSLRETLIFKLGEEAFGKLAQGLQNIQGEFMDFAATVAQSIGEAIGSGGSLADAFRNALRDLAIQVPKLTGMALLNAAAAPGTGRAALPLAIAGLALLGLSGIIAGATKPKDLSPSSPSIAGATPSTPQQGLGQFGERNALNFSGSTFVLEIDGEQFGARVGRVMQRGEKKRAR